MRHTSEPFTPKIHHAPVTVFLIASENIYYTGLVHIIDKQPDVQVVASTSPGGNYLSLYEKSPTKLLMIEESALQAMLKKTTPSRLFHTFWKVQSDLRIIIFGHAMPATFIQKMVRAGVHGIMDNNIKPKLLGTAIRKVADGCYWINRRGVNGTDENLQNTPLKRKPIVLQGRF